MFRVYDYRKKLWKENLLLNCVLNLCFSLSKDCISDHVIIESPACLFWRVGGLVSVVLSNL